MPPDTTLARDKMAAMFYNIITPVLSPMLYTLRNTKVQNAMRKLGIRMVYWPLGLGK